MVSTKTKKFVMSNPVLREKDLDKLKRFLDHGALLSWPTVQIHRHQKRLVEKAGFPEIFTELDVVLEQVVTLFRRSTDDLASQRQKHMAIAQAAHIQKELEKKIATTRQGFLECFVLSKKDMEWIQKKLEALFQSYGDKTALKHLNSLEQKNVLSKQNDFYTRFSDTALKVCSDYLDDLEQSVAPVFKEIEALAANKSFSMEKMMYHQATVRRKMRLPLLECNIPDATIVDDQSSSVLRDYQRLLVTARRDHRAPDIENDASLSEKDLLERLILRRQTEALYAKMKNSKN